MCICVRVSMCVHICVCIYVDTDTHTHTCYQTIEGKAIPELKDKNKAASVKWRDMSEEEKQRYYQLAVQLPAVSSPSHSSHVQVA